jgi:enolase-phosphatase E1
MIQFSGSVVLLDVEGTTSSVSYVYDVLFPYARRELTAFLAARWDEADVAAARARIAQDAGDPSLAGDRGRLASEVIRLMDADSKATGLKELQGLIWREGFRAGTLQAHVFADVPEALDRWTAAGAVVGIYSSGSVTAQKLFFGHTEAGDLLPYLRGHFDTTMGPKRERGSYAAIVQTLGRRPAEVLFLSDVAAELDAARDAGLATGLVLRPGNAPVADANGHPAVTSLAEVRVGEVPPFGP